MDHKINENFSGQDAYAFTYRLHDHLGEKLGAHIRKQGGVSGVYFAVWAPNAKQVYVAGSFNGWDPKRSAMRRVESAEGNAAPTYDCGVWETFVTEAMEGQEYLFVIEHWDGSLSYKTDPFALQYTVRPTHNCVINSLGGTGCPDLWNDDGWMEDRKKYQDYGQPINILEVHPGSFKRHGDGSFYTYLDLAKELPAYAAEMGYTHVELMGILEHPSDESWGYQVTGYYAPTSRYGSPQDFIHLVDSLHQQQIGVILDWIPAHFATDDYALANYDGTPTFEYSHPLMGNNWAWGTKIFDYGKNQVQSFLVSSALHWLQKFHIDGLRVDAVAAMLYLDYDKGPGQWIPNSYGGNTNLEAIRLLHTLNQKVHESVPGAITLAEESSAWPHVTGDYEDGLGFDYKWNMGWMHDVLDYMQTDPLYRKYNHNKMTFSLTYENAEQFVLPFSHDEVVHLKKPMLYKMDANDNRLQFQSLKVLYGFMFGHPGKKLLFMGDDFGVRSEWNEHVGLDWQLLAQPEHADLHTFVRNLMHLYRDYPVLWQQDDHRVYNCFDGFEWMECDDRDRGVFSFVRKWKEPKKHKKEKSLLFVLHFTPVDRTAYIQKAPKAGRYRLVLDANGYYRGDQKALEIEAAPCYEQTDNRVLGYEFIINVPVYGLQVYEYEE